MESSQGSTLYAEWQGELGYLLLWYGPAMRHLSRSFDRTIVAADASTEYLWEFATDFVPLKCRGHAMHTGKVLEGRMPDIQPDWFDARWGHGLFAKGWKKNPPTREHRKLGKRLESGSHPFMCAFRPPKSPKGKNPMRKAYPPEMCARLVELLRPLGTVAAYGGPDNWRAGAEVDLRGAGLEAQCDFLRSAKVAVGPSSGTMHLASLCGCPHVTFTDGHANVKRRYLATWNPFGASAKYLSEPNPEPEEVVEAVKEVMR